MSSSEPSDSRYLRSQASLETLIVQGQRNAKRNGDNGHGLRAVLIALAANLGIGSIKLIAGLYGRHSALLSEAMHSYADSVNSAFLLIGLQKGSRAADKSHPFGYGLETTLWAMLASVLMLVLAAWSMWLGINRMSLPEEMGGYWLSAIVLVVSIVLELAAVNVAVNTVLSEKEIEEKGWLRRFMAAARHVRTVVSPTTRFVYYEDSIALLGAIVALIAITMSEVGRVTGIIPDAYVHMPDAIASILIGLMLLGLSIYLFTHNSKGLTGGSANPQVEQRIRDYVLSIHGVSQVHDLKTIDYGLSGVVVHMRVEVDPDTQVKDVDDLTERIRDRIQARVNHIKEVIIEVLADEASEEWHSQFYRLVESGREKAILKPREERIFRNMMDFTQAVVSDIMVPRTAVDCIEVSETLDDLIALITETGHTRIPVYDEDVDNMLGAIHVKDVFSHLREGKTDIALGSMIRPFDIYPENKAVSDLLEDFKRKKSQIAMVADEHGGFAGIVTIEDLLEEIVGEIWDEYDDDTPQLELVDESTMLISGRCTIDEVNDRYTLNIPDEEFNTVGGFVFGLLGREPKVEDEAMFEDMTFTVLEMDGHRVEKVKLASPVPFKADQLDDEEPPPYTNGNGNTSPTP